MARRKLLFLCLIPVILSVLEIILFFTGMNFDHDLGSWVMSGWNMIGIIAHYGMFFLPFICLIPEITGFVAAAKQRAAVFRLIFIVELLLTLTACLFSISLFIQSLHHK